MDYLAQVAILASSSASIECVFSFFHRQTSYFLRRAISSATLSSMPTFILRKLLRKCICGWKELYSHWIDNRVYYNKLNCTFQAIQFKLDQKLKRLALFLYLYLVAYIIDYTPFFNLVKSSNIAKIVQKCIICISCNL
ncbi:Hypothetical_protein [Hexamita inflata]|uniref:Hypothetical_protein n=1 Tax=Hexamita inflata TaxID=28002 RepID=A0AA86R3Z4_9EUKA|nr:Hypothetical protein HINF_LOCUS53079 [Hexamita inflata]